MTTQFANEVFPVNIEQELKQSYLDYAMSVIVGRALPDVRDGLKPVHRRVLFAMKELGNDFNKPYKKSARVVGDVIGKYHPHGDTAVYDTIVRMAQPFSLRYMLVDGQGNFGSVDGDSPAAMRYTEVRMSKMAHSLLIDIDKETVNFSPNYDETEMIPDVLPTRIPNLLVNGSSGIAVGMATNIPPHNLNEVIDGVIALIENPELSIEELMEYIPGPDFPTGAYINGRAGIVDAYKTGRGRVIMRAKASIETDKKTDREQIIVTEIPYQVNKARLIEKIAELVKDKKIEGISELRDESDKDGMRIVVDVKRGEMAEVLLNNLYAQTQMQLSFGVNMVALVDSQPKLLNLKEVIEAFIRHRKEVVTRRTIFELRKARERAHLLEGLAIALSNIDEMIALIKASKTPAEAKEALLARSWSGKLVGQMLEGVDQGLYRIDGLASHYGLHNDEYFLSQAQVDAILELRLHRLTGLEQDKILDEFKALLLRIEELIAILKDIKRLLEVICEELQEVKAQFGDARRSEIIASQLDLGYEDLITEESMVVTLSYDGYVKAQPLKDYNAQKRGGRGKSSTQMKEEDFVYKLQIASTHAMMLCFSSLGKIYWSKVYEFPQAGRAAKGRPINNVFPLEQGERITAMLAVSEFTEGWNVFMATKQATVKKVDLTAFSRPRKGGIYALTLDEGDELLHVHLTNGQQEIMMFSNAGKAIRFNEEDVRAVGRTARGVRGMRIQEDQTIVGVIVTEPDHGVVLTATENGYGKRTPVAEYRKTARGSQGVISISTSDRNGLVVAAGLVEETDDIMLMTDQGVLIRTRVREVRETGRSAQGVKLINLKSDEKLVSVQVVGEDESEEDFDDEMLNNEVNDTTVADDAPEQDEQSNEDDSELE
ncbi:MULTISPECIES: DNA gyrase subunit A [Cysteiniphilum]|uniref:DNA gyrase subunit A n=1 Tax=Cysteiniphilum litorale TaxID=2056700 RepID=A0A8J3E818_9GAMM|nr:MULTISPECIES: DNA gyrase subunit A [Cysteiniphilum]GGF89807.1 DNA gyrase subunit A [Cysteiniphilum litorale]